MRRQQCCLKPCASSSMVALLAAAVQVAIVSLRLLVVVAHAAGGGQRIGLPNCTTSCGGVSVPYPFGVEAGCHLERFDVTCNTSYTPPLLFLSGIQVVSISLHDAMLYVKTRGIYAAGSHSQASGPPASRKNMYMYSGLHLFGGATVATGWEIGSSDALQGPNETRAGNATCPWDLGAAACHSSHSTCRATTTDGVNNVTGYVCRCDDGYEGNPYLSDGCQDIDECSIPGKYCFGDCTNIPGKYLCQCPKRTRGDPYTPYGCGKHPNTGLIIGIGVGSGGTLLFLVLGNTIIIRKIKTQRKKRMRQKFFKQNRGQLLQQLVSQRADIAERMIVSLDEVEKATNNFDKARQIGGGGHGTVYKGILSTLHVVAIKKSKIVIQREMNDFINEVAILSQINHKNVVKLLGCCLETEVPLLVYEFVSNGTLYDHLHVEALVSLSWRDRLRISVETARSLAYLHSLVSMPIIHRDVKSPNILLDDNMTVKLSDFGASRYVPNDQSGLDTTVQGTFGYLDPMYNSTGHLTEKSDVYSFGVILIELLTRKKPVLFRSPQGHGLVHHFVTLLSEGNLVRVLDPQVAKEGGGEVVDIALLAKMCVKFTSKDRPTMRQVEMILESIHAAKEDASSDMTDESLEYYIQVSDLSI